MRRIIILSLTATLAALNATAAPILYTSRGAWETAAGPIHNIDFEGIAAAGGVVDYSGSGLDLDGVHFESYSNGPGNGPSYLLVVDDSYPNNGCGHPCYDWGSGAVLHGSPANFTGFGMPSGIEATFAGTFAVGSDAWTIFPDEQLSGFEFRVIVTAGGVDYTYLVDSLAYPNRAFVGFVSDEAITAVRYEALGVGNEGGAFGPYVDLDNFAVAVPEPGSMFLVGSGLLAAGVLARRRRSKSRGTS